MTVLADLFIISFSITEPRVTCKGSITDRGHICVTERYVNTMATRSLHMPPFYSYFRPHRFSQWDDADVSTSDAVAGCPTPSACNAQAVTIFVKKDNNISSTKTDTESARSVPCVQSKDLLYVISKLCIRHLVIKWAFPFSAYVSLWTSG
jgi:hypothetical protein